MAKKRKAPPPGEGNKYDKIIKENLEGLIPAIINRVMHLRPERLENLSQVRLQTTIEREPDFLKRMYSSSYPNGCLLQIEFEGKDEKETDYRMLEYGAMLLRKYQMPVEQHLIYLPEGMPNNLKGSIDHRNISFRYSIHCISEISYEQFIHSNHPEEVLLSILANYKLEPPEVIIRLIVEQLIQLKGNSGSLIKFIRQLEILSGLRKLQTETIKIINSMSIEYDIREDLRYKQGKAEGIEQGKAEGIEQGEMRKAIAAIINMQAKGLEPSFISEVLELTPDFTLTIIHQLKKREQIIELLKKPDANVKRIASQLGVSDLLVALLQEDM